MWSTLKHLLTIGTVFLFVLLATGCMQGEQTGGQSSIPEEIELVEELSNNQEREEPTTNEDEDLVEETISRELFLIDANGMVVPQILDLPKTESKEVATQVLNYLVKSGPVSSILPNGFQAVLPEGTEVLGLNLQSGGTLIVDVSEEFKNYDAEDELNIIQAITYTLTQFDSVDRIQLRINGVDQTEMPVNGTPLSEGYSRNKGINIMPNNMDKIIEKRAVTIYYPKQSNDNQYYVPVTQYVEGDNLNLYDSIIRTLLDGPGYDTKMTHVFNSTVDLTSEPLLKDGVLQLVFNESILKDKEQAVISDDVVETIVRSLTEQKQVQAVDIKVENIAEVKNEKGKLYSEPVTKQSLKNFEI